MTLARTLLAVCLSVWMTQQAAAADYVILRVGDEKIKKSEVENIWKSLFPAGSAPDFESYEENVKQNVLRGIVSENLLYKEALAAGLEAKPEVIAKLDELKRKVLVKSLLEDKAKGLVTEEALKKEYDALVRKLRDTEEVKARHILLDSEDKAKEAKEKLDDGSNFEELAKELSIDKGSANVGGDLGYFTLEKMVPEFGKAAFALDKGKISDPVKSNFGWHIIKVEDKRKVAIPTFGDVKEQLKAKLEDQVLAEYVEKLIDKTPVKYLDAKGNEKDFSKVPDATQPQ